MWGQTSTHSLAHMGPGPQMEHLAPPRKPPAPWPATAVGWREHLPPRHFLIPAHGSGSAPLILQTNFTSLRRDLCSFLLHVGQVNSVSSMWFMLPTSPPESQGMHHNGPDWEHWGQQRRVVTGESLGYCARPPPESFHMDDFCKRSCPLAFS